MTERSIREALATCRTARAQKPGKPPKALWDHRREELGMAFLGGDPTSRGVPGWEAGEAASPDLATICENGRIQTADETLT